jgi:hypothetical protein
MKYDPDTERRMLAPYHEMPACIDDRKVFFLAGPIRGGGYWQIDAAEFLWNTFPGCIVADPSYNEPRVQHTPIVLYGVKNKHAFEERQVAWEAHAMQIAAEKGTLIFWLPEESPVDPRPPEKGPYAQDTRVELGIWIERHHNNPHLSVKIGGSACFYGMRFMSYYAKNGPNPIRPMLTGDLFAFLEKITP